MKDTTQKPLTLIQLKLRIDETINLNERSKEQIVCIPNNKAGVGGTSATNVVQAHAGFDWDSGRFLIYPEADMIEKPAGQVIIDANEPKYLLGVLRNLEREMPKAWRQRNRNVVVVKNILMAHTSTGGNTSSHEMCRYIGVDPDAYTFNEPPKYDKVNGDHGT